MQRCDLRDTCAGTPSNRILKDSSALTIQAYLVCGNLVVFYTTLLLASELTTFYERFFMVCVNF